MNPYLRYLTRRILIYFMVMFFALVINFMIPRFIPGNPIEIIIARMTIQAESRGHMELIEEYTRMFGLDADLFTQFVSYIKELLRGNLGYSIIYFPTGVSELILRGLPWTIGLLSMSTIISWGIGTFIGAFSGWRGQDSKLSEIFSSMALLLYPIPYFLMSMILVYLLAYTLGVFPISGGYSVGLVPTISIDFLLDVAFHSALPLLGIVISSLGWWYLCMRSMISGLKGEDFILFAEAKGLSKRRIMWTYAFRNALIPQVTGLAMSLGHIVGGSLLTEVIFAYPGLGWLLYTGTINLDYTLIQGVILLIILSVCTSMLILDLILPLIDPRIEHISG